jgi:quercetin dioxygenase-like cupin family protein
MKSDADVPNILKNDGVTHSVYDQANREQASVPDIVAKYGKNTSWSHTLVDSASNSATLICQLPGEGNRRHHHPDWNEWWYIYEGVWEWEIEGVKKEIKAGDVVFIERNRKHKITARGDSAAIRIAVSRYDVAHVYEDPDY